VATYRVTSVRPALVDATDRRRDIVINAGQRADATLGEFTLTPGNAP
jgi:hypothetical protein